jgi:hypothetical protein
VRRARCSASIAVATSVAILTACSLTTSLDGLSNGAARRDDAVTDVVTMDVDGGIDSSAPRSCRDVAGAMGATDAAADGVYRIDPDVPGPLPSIQVYCNMTTAGGGWTLVDAAGLTFASILVGVRGAAKELVLHAYTMNVSTELTKLYASAPLRIVAVAVLGDCAPPGGPDMLRNVGFTNNTENFFFRDVGEERDPQNVSYGLFADGFRTRYDDCARGRRNARRARRDLRPLIVVGPSAIHVGTRCARSRRS